MSSLIHLLDKPEVHFVSGLGDWLVGSDERRYLDFVQGWAVNCLGHAYPQLADAVSQQAHRLFTPSPAYHNDKVMQLADKLTTLSGLDRANFVNSGAEANEAAIKLARKWGQLHKKGAYRMITFKDGFHGRTLATMSASGKPAFGPLFEPKVDGFDKVRFNDLSAVEAMLSDDHVAIMLELIQGEGGVVEASKEFVLGLRVLCDKHKLLLIIDEVQTGIGRTGELFAYQHYGIKPDILTLGKGLGGGIPIAAMVAQEHCLCFSPGDQGSTFGGNPLSAAAGLAVLEEVAAPSFLANVRRQAEKLRSLLTQISDDFELGHVYGRGLLLALNTHGSHQVDAHEIEKRAFQECLLVNGLRPHLLRVMPALNVTDEALLVFDQKLRRVLQSCS
ncbi:acetylornithine transaminase [Corallincola platygyrae]|uniref:Acetylornithine transaminase n=1 Tax=Corallincola platygyrae TaxID=1193278 RepID=A0ABW4XJ90_9GAMM